MKKLLAIILSVAMLLSLAACSGNDAADDTDGELGLVGFCSVSLSESIYVLTQQALEEIFAGKAEVQTVSCDNDASTQISQIKTFVTMGADLIIINPTDVDALADAIKEAHEAGVKVYINGATSDNLSDEYYDCCTVSNEYLCGAYVALIAKNWIEAHADQLSAANPNWEVAFLQSSLSEETLERSAGEMKWVITLNEDGTAVFGQPENEGMGNPMWTAVWTDNGDGTFTTSECVGEGPQIATFWENNAIVWQLLNDNCAVPVKADDYAAHVDAHGIPTGGAAPVAAGEYTFMEATPFGEFKWTVTLNEDGTAVVAQPENEGMGCPTWTAVWTDNGNGTFTTAECTGEGPMIADFWNNNSITWTDNGDGTVTPVGYSG